MEEFNWYFDRIVERQNDIKECQKDAVKSADISDYWKLIRTVEKRRHEVWTLEQMARERGLYVVTEN